MSKVILITGTRKGIGKELVLHYLKKGNRVAGFSRGQSDIMDKNYQHFCLDVSQEAPVVKAVSDIRKKYGRIDVLINNAGIASMNHFVTTPIQTVSKLFETNFMGSFICMREVAKVMMKKKYGRIVNMTSVASALRLAGEAVYAASKAAIENLTQTAAKELGGVGITVNAIGPTPIPTDLTGVVPKKKIQELVAQQAIRRLGSFQDVTNLIDFLIDDKSDFITGQVIYLGGIHGA